VSKHQPHHHEAGHSPPEDANPQAAGDAKPQAAPDVSKPQVADFCAKADSTADPQKLRGELAASKDRELRAHAEVDNVRKRLSRELEEHRRYASLPLLRDLMPLLDNVDRAIEAGDKNADAAALLEGFKMVSQQLADILKRHHCTRIEALHEPFDPNLHHAIMQQPSEEHPANTVLMVTQNGYQLHDRVVRPSQVIVSTTK
jgi:molecular chaperone GrpE